MLILTSDDFTLEFLLIFKITYTSANFPINEGHISWYQNSKPYTFI